MISVIIPTYNEKKNITKISKKLLKQKIVSEIIFVDDDSSDGSYLEIKKLKKKKKINGFLRKKKPRDLSSSVLYGVRKSKKNLVLIMDSDLQHDVQYINLMKKKMQTSKSDILIASRFQKKKISGNLGALRSLFSFFAISAISFVFGKKTSDPLSGFFLCKKNLILKFEKNFYAKGYKILFDVIYNGKKDIKIQELNIIFKKRSFEKSKFNFRIIWLFLKQMMYTKFVVKK